MVKIKDLSGLRFGYWTVLYRASNSKNGNIMWTCKCDCGTIKDVRGSALTQNKTKSCGCKRDELLSESKTDDLTGLHFGRLTVLCKYKEPGKKAKWLCECECGNYTLVYSIDLRCGNTRSCNCYRKEQIHNKIGKHLIGEVFGDLAVLAEYTVVKTGRKLWICKCLNCYNFSVVSTNALTRGNSKSCGCKQREAAFNSHNGENHPLWKGGIAYLPYCYKFNKKLKEKIRDKFNRKCLICGKTEEESGRKLDIHHVDYQKDQGCGDHKWQLVPLCRSCHIKTNHNRTFWEYNIKWIIKQKENHLKKV